MVIRRPREVESQMFAADIVAMSVGGGFGMETLKMAGYTHAGRQAYFPVSIDRRRAYPVAARAPTGLDWLDCALIGLFLLGLYTNYTIQIAAKVPFPSLPTGIAGILLLWRRRDLIRPAHLAGLVSILLLYLISILCAT